MQIVLNSSPLIFLAKLGYLNQFIEYPDDFYIPQSVAEEISAKSDPASQTIQTLINAGKLQVRTSSLRTLVNSLNQRLGKLMVVLSDTLDRVRVKLSLSKDYN